MCVQATGCACSAGYGMCVQCRPRDVRAVQATGCACSAGHGMCVQATGCAHWLSHKLTHTHTHIPVKRCTHEALPIGFILLRRTACLPTLAGYLAIRTSRSLPMPFFGLTQPVSADHASQPASAVHVLAG